MSKFLLSLSLGAALLPALAQADEVMVFAAASMKTSLDQVAQKFEAATGHHVTISYAGSNALAKQITEGAPADIFISASSDWMDAVETAGEVAKREDLLGNSLVLVGHDAQATPLAIDAGLDLAGLLGGGKLSMALVESVPAGQYGKAALQSLGLWDKVSGDVAQSDNVRAALGLVARGEAPYGIVYATDARAEPQVHVAGQFPADSHPPITYPAALLKNGTDAGDLAFYEALRGEEANAIFRAEGFTLLP